MSNYYEEELKEFRTILERTDKEQSQKITNMLHSLVCAMESFCSEYRASSHVRKKLQRLDAKLSTDFCDTECEEEGDDEDEES